MKGVLLPPQEAFFAHVRAWEGAAATHYTLAAEKALAAGEVELEAFFASLAELTHMDAEEARIRSGLGKSTSLSLRQLQAFPELTRTAIAVGSAALLGLHHAMAQALETKRHCHAYYASVATLASDAQLRQIALAFQYEAAAHLAALERWITRLTT